MNGDARRVVEHAALIVDVETAPQHEGVAVIAVRPPGALAGRKIQAGDRGVVAAGPAAERGLHGERGKTRERELTGSRNRRGAAAAARTAGGFHGIATPG